MKKRNHTKKSDHYTPTEVGTILESLHKEIKVIAEGHAGLDKRLENLEVEVHGNSRRLDMLELRFTVLNDKATRLEDAVSKLSKDFKQQIDDLRRELKSEIAAVGQEVAGLRTELKGDLRDLGARVTLLEGPSSN